jgi:N-acetylglutamate synthase-like GNAT family acetyltransferase
VSKTCELGLAREGDVPELRELLASAGLPVDDVSVELQEYVLARDGGALVGCVGLEVHGDLGLLRSFAVVPELRRQGLGTVLFEAIVARALLRGVRTAYVLTTTAERFCLAHGFERVERSAVPAAIAGTEQFGKLCPSTAACFRRSLGAAPVRAGRA